MAPVKIMVLAALAACGVAAVPAPPFSASFSDQVADIQNHWTTPLSNEPPYETFPNGTATNPRRG